MKSHVDRVYETVKDAFDDFDAIYEDYIIRLVGILGLTTLLENGLLETCGTVNGRQLFVLCERKE